MLCLLELHRHDPQQFRHHGPVAQEFFAAPSGRMWSEESALRRRSTPATWKAF
jgi:hypothetical protein